MAQSQLHICTSCGHTIEAWSDGNPYYIDSRGKKQYAYHPDHEKLARCIGNDDPHLCLACGAEFMVDSEAPVEACPKCGSSEIRDTYSLAGCRCPFCKKGRFPEDPMHGAVS